MLGRTAKNRPAITGLFSIEDAYKLDDVREALRQRDLQSAAKYGRIYELRPVVNQ